MWGMGGWTGSDDEESLRALDRAIALGCTFFDTAWAYGEGKSEKLLGETRRHHPDSEMFIATKIPPKNLRWPGKAEYPVSETYPANHIREYTEKSLANLGVDAIDLQQFHVWSDAWAGDKNWQREVDALKREKLVRAFGVSVNRREATNVLRALDTELIDSVQVVYNVFDQAPEDELFPYCEQHNIAIIARVPFDEGSLTGTLTPDSKWPEGDFRNIYFNRDTLPPTLERVDRLKPLVPDGMDMPELALRFILEHQAVSTTIPGMRKPRHVERNLAAGDGVRLPPRLHDALKRHRWDRPVNPSP
ncbi:MAG: aldo/keto reductase [Acidobacteria bacterium 13_1_40CM_65_14]|nr:MAG: aldo/keto reductase [Acidobacteria bacterium 13_1_40CM_65_14]